ncbi:MAG: hypothetical protein ABJH06_11925 [Paraglaciecola sp.]|uniref:hypothetical protein n=1 Tax=Paraglaciecola sp. TaxID=1920173 RepID=UPI0032967C09
MKNLLAASIPLIFILIGCQSSEENTHTRKNSIQEQALTCDPACRKARVELVRADHNDGPGTTEKTRHFAISYASSLSKWRNFKFKIVPNQQGTDIDILLIGQNAPTLYKIESSESEIEKMFGGMKIVYPFYYRSSNGNKMTDDLDNECKHSMTINIFNSPFQDNKHNRVFFYQIDHIDESQKGCHSLNNNDLSVMSHETASSSGGGRN